MKTKKIKFTTVIFTVFIAMFMIACSNPFLHDDEDNDDDNNTYTMEGSKLGPSGSAPSTPAGLSKSTANSTSISLSWYSVSGATSYRVYRSSTSGGTFSLVGSPSTASYTNTDLTANTTYYYKVAAYNSYGTSSQSSYLQATTAPAAPTGLTKTAATSNSISLSWNTVTGATGYYIYRSTSSTGPFTTPVGTLTTNTTSYTDTSPTANTTYYYKVAANNTNGTGDQSTYVSIVTMLAIPTGLTTMPGSSTSITLSWNAVTGATEYYIYRSTEDSNYSKLDTGSLTTTSYTNTGITENTTYYYKVSAYNSNGESSHSAAVLQNNSSAPAAPTGLTTTAATGNSISLSWDSVASATGYYIYRSTSSTGAFTYIGTSTTISYTNTGLSLSTTYYYKVSAYNDSGTGQQSASVYAATQTSSTYTITISGTAKAGQTLTVSIGGTGWSSNNYSWGYADSANASQFVFLSGYTSNSFTIPQNGMVNGVNLIGKYIRAFRRHPNGTWNETDQYGQVVAKIFPSNFIGPIQPAQ